MIYTKTRWLLSCLAALFALGPVICCQAKTDALSPAAVDAFQRGTDALHAGRMAEVVANFQQVTREAPRFAEGYLNLGLGLAQLSRNEEAVQALEKALTFKPSLRGARLFLAIADYNLGRFEAAAAAIRKETAATPGNAQAWMWQGIIDLARGQLTPAVEDLDRASTLDPRNVDILYHRGRAALALSRHSYEAMFQLDPKSWHVNQVLAEADVESGNDKDAVEQFKLAIAAAPPQGGLYEAMGSALWRLGRYEDAQQAYETALKLDPNDSITLYKLGCLRVDRSDAAGGKPLLERALAADPALVMTRYYLGRAESQLGNDQAAIAYFTKTVDEHLDDETTKLGYFQLARAYRRIHNLPASEEAQARYRQLDAQTKTALQDKLAQRRARADRDSSIPAPAASAEETP